MGASQAALRYHCNTMAIQAPCLQATYAGPCRIAVSMGISLQQFPAFLSEKAVAGLWKSAAIDILACFPKCDAGIASTFNADDNMDGPLLHDDLPSHVPMQSDSSQPSPQICPPINQ